MKRPSELDCEWISNLILTIAALRSAICRVAVPAMNGAHKPCFFAAVG
jgi:hypothetical protein